MNLDYPKNKEYLKVNTFLEIFNSIIKKNTILIIEPNQFHHECTPGYVKYFYDLGYNVDVLFHISGNDSFCLFPESEKIRIRTFQNVEHLKKYAKYLSIIINILILIKK